MLNNQKKLLYYFRSNEPFSHKIYQKRLNFQHSSSSRSLNNSRSICKSTPKLQNRKLYNRDEDYDSNIKKKKRKQRIPFQLYTNKKFFQNNYTQQDRKNSSRDNSLSSNNKLPQPNIFEVISQNISMQQTQQHTLNSNIKVQPGTHFFLCKNCFQFYLTLQIRQHSKSCKFYNTQRQFKQKWFKLAQLLNKIATEHGKYRHQQLYTLSQEMKMVIQKGKTELKKSYRNDSIKKYRNKFIEVNDIFWVIDEIEFQMRSKKQNKKLIWMPCKGDNSILN